MKNPIAALTYSAVVKQITAGCSVQCHMTEICHFLPTSTLALLVKSQWGRLWRLHMVVTCPWDAATVVNAHWLAHAWMPNMWLWECCDDHKLEDQSYIFQHHCNFEQSLNGQSVNEDYLWSLAVKLSLRTSLHQSENGRHISVFVHLTFFNRRYGSGRKPKFACVCHIERKKPTSHYFLVSFW